MLDWQEIYRTHGPLVWKTVYRALGNHADASDCLQETFLAAMSVARREQVRNWPGLLRRIATSRAINQLRQRCRDRERNTELTDCTVACGGFGPVGLLEERELAERLREALARLPASQAEVFWLCQVEGLSYREAARTLGVSTVTVGVLLHRARARLSQVLPRDLTGEKTRKP